MGMSSKSLRGFGYRNGALHAEQVDLAGLAAEVGYTLFSAIRAKPWKPATVPSLRPWRGFRRGSSMP